MRTETVGENLYVHPDEAMPYLAAGKLDRRLFDVTSLIEQGYDDEHSTGIPLIVSSGAGARSTRPVPVIPKGTTKVLMACLEAVWERAYPVLPNTAGEAHTGTPAGGIDELDARILALMLAGLTDQAAAGQLGTSRRTYQRRTGDLTAKAGVGTWVQLGRHAARRGWA
ncbi:helix-turn-helix transcriptional regulator [Streptomyces sp. NPDC058572]|uniref:helix-turn-helix transcriptional regulator n=1 Tax=Streptomyces sp. NPDC058572 TaxID=3346546 RepID=UPI0036502B75